MKETAASRHRRRLLLPVMLAAALTYLSTCQLPRGRPVTLRSGRVVEVVAIARRITRGTQIGRLEELVIQYYGSPRADEAEAFEVASQLGLNTGATDSVLLVEQINGARALRLLGVRIAHHYRFVRATDGGWARRTIKR